MIRRRSMTNSSASNIRLSFQSTQARAALRSLSTGVTTSATKRNVGVEPGAMRMRSGHKLYRSDDVRFASGPKEIPEM